MWFTSETNLFLLDILLLRRSYIYVCVCACVCARVRAHANVVVALDVVVLLFIYDCCRSTSSSSSSNSSLLSTRCCFGEAICFHSFSYSFPLPRSLRRKKHPIGYWAKQLFLGLLKLIFAHLPYVYVNTSAVPRRKLCACEYALCVQTPNSHSSHGLIEERKSRNQNENTRRTYFIYPLPHTRARARFHTTRSPPLALHRAIDLYMHTVSATINNVAKGKDGGVIGGSGGGDDDEEKVIRSCGSAARYTLFALCNSLLFWIVRTRIFWN